MRMGPLFINQGDDDDESKMGRRKGNPSCSGDSSSRNNNNAVEQGDKSSSSFLGLAGNNSSANKNTTLTMLSSNSSSSADSGNFEEKQAPKNGTEQPLFRGGSGLITKYLVLLQDCVAIKFVAVQSAISTRMSSDHSTLNRNSLRRRSRSSFVFNESPFSDDDPDVPLSSRMMGAEAVSSNNNDHCHAIQGIQLFKLFKEANLKCYWNATLCDAIRSLEYKGWLLPSTILVGGGDLPHRLSLIRTAWARKMLRNPTGFRIEFIGEIEEIIAEPVSQGQFAPLSDSLCWAILELTSSGQEAFVDSILLALSDAFPLMSLPPRELVYTTLERLIRDRKIYQTSQGYFIVSPDTFRYMNAGGEGQSQAQTYHNNLLSGGGGTLPLDALTSSYYDVDKISQHSCSSGSRDDLLRISRQDEHEILGNRPLKRHNSLRVIRQRDLEMCTPTMGARSLSFRLSKPKPLPVPESVKPEPTCLETKSLNSQKDNKSKKQSFFRRLFSFRRSTSKLSKSAKSESKIPKPLATMPTVPKLDPVTKSSAAVSLELLQRSPKIYAQLPLRNTGSNNTQSIRRDAPNRSYEDILEDEITLPSSSRRQIPMMSKWNSLPSSSSGRRSRRSILNESPFYDVLQFNNGHQNSHNYHPHSQPSGRNNNNGAHNPNPSRASSSLGYGSQRPLSMGIYSSQASSGKSFEILGNSGKDHRRRSLSRIDSPSPSVSTIYASIGCGPASSSGTAPPTQKKIVGPRSRSTPRIAACQPQHLTTQINTTNSNGLPPPIPITLRARHPHNKYPPWRPRSAYELLAYQNLQNSKRLSSMQRKPSLTELQQHQGTKIKIASTSGGTSGGTNKNIVSHHHHHHGNTGAEVISTSTIKSSTELQLQIPLGRMVSNIPSRSGGKISFPAKNVDKQPSGKMVTVQLKTNQGGSSCNSSVVTSTYDQNKHITEDHSSSSAPSPNTSTDEGVVVDVTN